MKEMKTRKTYEKPTMTFVELRHRTHLLLQASGVQSTRNSYGTANYGVTPNEQLDSDGNWNWE